MKHILRITGITVLIAASTVMLACGSGDDGNKSSNSTPGAPGATQVIVPTAGSGQTAGGYTPRKLSGSVTLQGAGATFPAPIYTKMFEEYSKFDSNVKTNYQAIGSSGGIKNFTEKTVDFGASDAFLTDKQYQDAGGKNNVIMIPTVLGAIVLTYNLPGVRGDINLSPENLAGIYLGEIKKWNDAKLKSDNPNVSLPDAEITVVRRSDGSGTTSGFTSYLSLISTAWKDKVGAGTSVQWPVGIGGQGNDGVTGQVKQVPGSIGYVELSYATLNKLPVLSVKNKNGRFVKPTLETTAAAAADLSSVTDDLNLNLLNAAGDNAYPIVSATWLILNRNYENELKGNAVANLVWWMTHEGQRFAGEIGYAPLPAELLTKVEARLKLIEAAGKPVIA